MSIGIPFYTRLAVVKEEDHINGNKAIDRGRKAVGNLNTNLRHKLS